MDLTLLAGKAGSADRFIDTVKQGVMGRPCSIFKT